MEDMSSNGESNRRSFLTKIIILIGGFIGAALTGIGGSYFLSPLWRKNDESWIDIGLVTEFKPGFPVKTDFTVRKKDAWNTIVSRASAWILTADQREFIAFDPKCTHLGCPFSWSDDRKEFLCPCHTAVFGIDGRVISGPPPRPLDRYQTKVVGTHVYLMPVIKQSNKEA